MARKSKRRPARRPSQAPPSAGARPQQPNRGAAAGPTTVGGGQATVRAVEMSLGPKTATKKPIKGQRVVLDDADPSIPIDRVPFFLPDLKRLAVVAGAMVVLLVAGEKLVPLVVK